ncbi:signal peptidase I [Amycolatopsis carbonis]|uniref:Signal peptidase I n=1 Tax=Amycolatopsis carbonis TaxID=715471 RepID=A0A9Y2IFI4_9PSEU|nr:signal peptidase I [Amycolatopsis sp. 2-15]WIX78051.1 signal peptidase I [Amycolatopsis sp. 2-15]
MTDFPAPPAAPPRTRRFSPFLALFVIFVVAGPVLGVTGAVKLLGYTTVRIGERSMETTVADGEPMVLHWAGSHEIHRGDLVLFQIDAFPGSPPGYHLLDRVIAVGGDRVVCCGPDSRLQVNGKSVTEPYLDPVVPLSAGAYEFTAQVPPGSIFVAGDRRDITIDSRRFVDEPGGGAIPLSKVDGVIVARGTVFSSVTLKPTTAFADAGLPGASTADTGLRVARYLVLGGVALFVLGFIGLIVTVARSGGRRRTAAAGPPMH